MGETSCTVPPPLPERSIYLSRNRSGGLSLVGALHPESARRAGERNSASKPHRVGNADQTKPPSPFPPARRCYGCHKGCTCFVSDRDAGSMRACSDRAKPMRCDALPALSPLSLCLSLSRSLAPSVLTHSPISRSIAPGPQKEKKKGTAKPFLPKPNRQHRKTTKKGRKKKGKKKEKKKGKGKNKCLLRDAMPWGVAEGRACGKCVKQEVQPVAAAAKKQMQNKSQHTLQAHHKQNRTPRARMYVLYICTYRDYVPETQKHKKAKKRTTKKAQQDGCEIGIVSPQSSDQDANRHHHRPRRFVSGSQNGRLCRAAVRPVSITNTACLSARKRPVPSTIAVVVVVALALANRHRDRRSDPASSPRVPSSRRLAEVSNVE